MSNSFHSRLASVVNFKSRLQFPQTDASVVFVHLWLAQLFHSLCQHIFLYIEHAVQFGEVKRLFAGVQGPRNHSVGFHRVLDSILRHQHRLSAVSVVPWTLVRWHGRRDGCCLVGLHLVDSQSHRLYTLQRGFPCRFLSHSDVQASRDQCTKSSVHQTAGTRARRHGSRLSPATAAAAASQKMSEKSTQLQCLRYRPCFLRLAADCVWYTHLKFEISSQF